MNGKNISGHYSVEQNGNFYILTFTVPDNQRYQAKFYKYADSSYSTMGSFYIQE